MVFAKNEGTASFLSKAWRERDRVSKHYLAVVQNWPPYHKDGHTSGTIDVPLAPSEERLKWKVVGQGEGKSSVTKWKVLENVKLVVLQEQEQQHASNTTKALVVLELQPITGRTHQLRIHCAHVGSGICGDSLYGTSRVQFDPLGGGQLHLHACKLSFPHPKNEEQLCEFGSSPAWLKGSY
jgi:23S rRNA-/tRNA-specific pseudouridylate synthase